MRRVRALLIAEAANPEWVSVPLVGWSHSRALADVADTHIVTQVRNREAFLRAGLIEGDDFTAIDSERVAAPLWKLSSRVRGGIGKGFTTAIAIQDLSYYYFEWLLWRGFRDRVRSADFDVVHRITPLSPTAQSPIAAQCRRIGVPFVLGPLNGGLPWPRYFDRERRREREWLSYVRSLYKLMPYYDATRRDAAAIIVGSQDTLAQVPRSYHQKCVYMPENGVDPGRFNLAASHGGKGTLRIAFAGRLVPYKGADMLLEAVRDLVAQGRVVVDIVGDGPEMPRLRQFVAKHRLEQGIRLDGWVDQTRLQERLVQASVFAFPSIREFGGGSVLEAMALGLVPVVVDRGGPAEIVTAETGYRVPIGRRDEIISGFREVLSRLEENRSGLSEMASRGRARVQSLFTWKAKARQTLEVYRWVLGRRADKPDFGIA